LPFVPFFYLLELQSRFARTVRERRNTPVVLVPGAVEHDLVDSLFEALLRDCGAHPLGAGAVILRPASAGTGVIAGGAVRPVLEVAGVQDILTKCIGTSNPHNVVHATIDALQQLRSTEAAARLRDKRLDEVRD